MYHDFVDTLYYTALMCKPLIFLSGDDGYATAARTTGLSSTD